MVELCLKSNRRGFDYSTPPIVVGTPFKVLDSIRSTPAALLSCLKYLVLDEVDRQIPVPGRYAVVKEKYDNDKSPANELIDFILDYKIKKLGASDLQVVAASATVGRPLRRELFKIFNKEGDNTYGGDFFVIRPEEKTRDDDKDLSTFTREERLSLKSKRKIGIPDSISHTAVLDSDSSSKEADGLGSKAAIAKSFWVDNPQYKRGIVFVRHTDEVKQVSGMLRFWGLKETKDLQQMLGLEISKKPTAKKLLGKGRIVKQSFVDLPAVSSSEKSNSLIANAMTSGIGSGSNSAIKTSERDLFVVPASGTRGLHIQDIDVVLILQPPATMDEYLHMAGRTGRWGGQDDAMSRRGQVITIANLEEWKRLQSWETPLGIDFDMQYR